MTGEKPALAQTGTPGLFPAAPRPSREKLTPEQVSGTATLRHPTPTGPPAAGGGPARRGWAAAHAGWRRGAGAGTAALLRLRSPQPLALLPARLPGRRAPGPAASFPPPRPLPSPFPPGPAARGEAARRVPAVSLPRWSLAKRWGESLGRPLAGVEGGSFPQGGCAGAPPSLPAPSHASPALPPRPSGGFSPRNFAWSRSGRSLSLACLSSRSFYSWYLFLVYFSVFCRAAAPRRYCLRGRVRSPRCRRGGGGPAPRWGGGHGACPSVRPGTHTPSLPALPRCSNS